MKLLGFYLKFPEQHKIASPTEGRCEKPKIKQNPVEFIFRFWDL